MAAANHAIRRRTGHAPVPAPSAGDAGAPLHLMGSEVLQAHLTPAGRPFAVEATSSRAHPTRACPKAPPAPANPRNHRGGKPCDSREFPPIPAQPGSAMTGLSRRRSRVRVPSLPSKSPGNSPILLSRPRTQSRLGQQTVKSGTSAEPLSAPKRTQACPDREASPDAREVCRWVRRLTSGVSWGTSVSCLGEEQHPESDFEDGAGCRQSAGCLASDPGGAACARGAFGQSPAR
jgi:hypothetical protein